MKEPLDFLSQDGAAILAQRIKSYWAKKGHTIKTHIVQSGPAKVTVFGVRSNLLNGLPPKQGA